ncbi:hypothetical protein M3L71_08220 [Wolbachia endosymbiont of Frankliniella intonsa]|nr:citrate/2-methylcitrate synthase [Wolbachia endosymbiont of Frankliniella intonsa]WGJ62148.1 hypothetical protein M3L71_08220 [Wolbachia endosymbiont of Frankliniella intonsa]
MQICQASYHENVHGNNVNGEDLDFGISCTAKVPAIVAMIYRHINNQEFINANNKLSYSENFLNMIFGSDVNNTLFVKALDKIFTLHADHEQNASTAAVRLVGSAGSNLFASLCLQELLHFGVQHTVGALMRQL